ncbi:apolipoprotein N-acyltransferase [Roseovarius aestuarii]|uniref:Apolipoprotein N-acyltransferase n=2 Tax=Roseovarius aestuarii TaxID=475083 RepID=A0A1X7BSW1_9RHOB|nr:apolipoprotein N-acyltransferase [Roseovarius aestuarii]SMC12693.1 Apolipoprotein N-acyltransferase [Roseovarius aestuarii]
MTDMAQPGFASRVNGLRGVYRISIWLGLGALAALGQAPWGLWPLTIAALALIIALFRQAPDMRRALLMGWVAGTGYFMLALSWIVEPFLVDVARHGWMAPFALIGLSAYLAFYWAAGFAVARALGGGSVALIVAFTVGESLRGYLFTGFPWAQIGHVWIDTPMLQWAAFAGPLGLIAVTWAAATALWHLVARRQVIGGGVLAGIAALYLTGALIAPATATATDAPKVRLVQPNAPQHEKWDPAMIPIFFDRQLEFSAAGDTRPDLIVWPETSIPVLLNNAEPALEAISDAAGEVPVVAGLQRLDGSQIYNSLVALGADGTVTSLYDKHHLVPFGEFVPFGNFMARFGIAGIAAQDGHGFSAGPRGRVIELGDIGKALPLICYESVFARDLRAAPERADFILLITNDAWFGKISGPYQHLAQARLRSVEQGLPMIRAANTGISAMIDPAGRITHSLPLGQAGWIDAPLPLPRPPTLYARIGDLPVLAVLLLILGGTVLRNRAQRPPR